VDLKSARFRGADLAFTQFEANLADADFEDAGLAWADFGSSNLHGASLKGAELRQTRFQSARLDECDFSRAHLEGTDFLDVSLESLCNSSSVIHEGPCFIDHRTVLRSLRAATLKDCLLRMGTPPIFVEYMVDCAKSIQEPGMV